MDSLQILNLVVGVTFIYFLLSIICSSIIEMVNNLSKLRAKMLEQWVIDNFDYEKGNIKLGSCILETSAVDGLTLRGKKPSYLPSSVFVRALFDQIMKDHQDRNNQEVKPYGMTELKEGIEKTDLLRPGIKRMILQYIKDANDDLEKTRKSMENWFDSAMERLGGTFKKHSQLRLFIIGLIISIILNVDTVVLVKYFYQNPKMASQIADAAQKTANDAITFEKYAGLSSSMNKDTSLIDTVAVDYKNIVVNITRDALLVDSLHTVLYSLNIPMGWQQDAKTNCWIIPRTPGTWTSKFFGILISGFALSMGSVFWFDLLNKLVNLRSSVKPAVTPANEKEDEKEKDKG